MDDRRQDLLHPGLRLRRQHGDRIAIHQTDPMDPMFPTDGTNNWDGFTPGCWMQKQATWYGPDFFPDVKANPGSDTMYPDR